MTEIPCSRCNKPLNPSEIAQPSKEFPALVCPKCAKEIEEERRKKAEK
jgi:recombinational DNA repair protein (RecF pathway)